MKPLTPSLFASCALLALATAPAYAEEPEHEPPLPAPASADPSPRENMSCVLGEHAGIPDADALTGARLVCADLAHAGAAPGDSYRVSLGKLGTSVILGVSREGTSPRTVAESREIRLQSIEEVSVAGPRIAESIVHGTPLGETERVDNLVGEETRRYKTKPGSVHFALGLVGMLPPLSEDVRPAPGIDLDVHYETKSFELGGALRGGGGQANYASPKIALFMASIGGAYFLSDQDVSPYLGGGLAWETITLDIADKFSGYNSGLGAYATVGVQMLRTHHAHLALGLRFDLPFFSLNSTNSACYSYYPNSCSFPYTSYYYAPVQAEIRLTF